MHNDDAYQNIPRSITSPFARKELPTLLYLQNAGIALQKGERAFSFPSVTMQAHTLYLLILFDTN
jgi:hypothetical protein